MSRATFLGILMVGVLALGACSAPPAPDVPARTLAVPVVSLYAQHCTECHVRDQRNFATEPYTFMDDAELRSLVRKQAHQEANVTLDPAQADAMTAFFKAMIAEEPFVSVSAQRPGVLEGEATLDAQVTLRWPTEQVLAQRRGPTWQARLPAGLRLADARIEARAGASVTRLEPTRASHSHAVASSAAARNTVAQ